MAAARISEEEQKEILTSIADVIHSQSSILIFNPRDREHYCIRICEDIKTDKTVEFFMMTKPEPGEHPLGYAALAKFEVYSYEEYLKIMEKDSFKENGWEEVVPGPELEI